ncbi:MAG: hypothetical protein ACI4MN_01250 [Candidatus Coproplasma sp.]
MAVTNILIIVICAAAVIGGVIGIFKRASGLSFWGITVLLGVLISWLVAYFTPTENGAYSWLILGITVGATVLLMGLFGWFKKFLEKRVKNAQEYSHFANTDKLEENEAYVLDAVDSKNKRKYRKLRRKRRRIKDSKGGWGIVDRILGFIVGGIDWLVAVGVIISALLLFVEFSGITFIQEQEFVKELLASDGWVKLGGRFAIDMMLIGTAIITVKVGFKKGIFYIITPVVVLSMIGGFGYASWAIASAVDCSGLQTGMLASLNEINPDVAEIVAEVIVAAIIFILSFAIVIVTGIFLPKLINKYRDNDAFYVIDGILGAIVSLVFLIAVYIALGGVAYTLNDLAFMSSFNSYEAQSTFANVFYEFNPFQSVWDNLPLHDWLVPQT